MNFQRYNNFINEQKEYFNNYLKPNFTSEWDDTSWYGGTTGSGWLLSRSGKTHFNFTRIERIKGLDNNDIDKKYQEFIKSVLVLSYRKSNSKASPQKLYAEFLILKRWYSALYAGNKEKIHPCNLSTLILNTSFEILAENSSKVNLPDHAGTYLRLQEIINYYGFTESSLDFSKKYLYQNRQNRTPNARRTKDLVNELELNEDDLNKDKLISIQTFINIVSLISLCETKGEKIVLNLLLLLIITGMRSTEAILIKTDALIKQPILDPVSKEQIILDGIKQYTLGIHYHGAKNSGFRTYWVEPSSITLVESIFQAVLDLTLEYRERILYIKSKGIQDFLPKEIDEIDTEYIESSQLVDTVFRIRPINDYTYDISHTQILLSTLKKVPVFNKIKDGKKIKYYYLKKDINDFIRSITPNYTSKNPLVHIFNYEGNVEKIAYEDILFIHEYKSANIKRQFSHITNIIPLTVGILNNFLGNGHHTSIFEKHNLKENSNEYSKLTSHIPRHNINTFLALSGLSEHLQAMLMGRVDIKQNQYYQHLALKDYRFAASLVEKQELALYDAETKFYQKDPVSSIKNDGLMYFSESLNLENNIKMNLQSFDSKKEVASYIKSSIHNEYFEDIVNAFNELVPEDDNLANSLIYRHAYLHPLPFGACMRELTTHGCPKRLACQSGDPCGNFALTNRKDELETLQFILQKLLIKFNFIKQKLEFDLSYKEMLESLHQKIIFLKNLEKKSLTLRKSLNPLEVFPYSNQVDILPTTLSELFAIEQLKIEGKS